MNNRFSTLVAAAVLVTLTSGCCGSLSNLWFGRGASCGLCNKLPCFGQPKFGNTMQAPCSPQPFVAPAPSCQPAPSRAPIWQAPQAHAPQWQAPSMPAPQWQGPSSVASDCPCQGSAGQWGSDHSAAYGGDCNCGGGAEGFASSGESFDPYMSADGGHSVGMPGEPYPGQVINGEVVVAPGTMGTESMPGDNFAPRQPSGFPPGSGNIQSRRFDTDGNQILFEEPLPPGIRSRDNGI
jgi:hypothetical protein